jgi:hypothetical protein
MKKCIFFYCMTVLAVLVFTDSVFAQTVKIGVCHVPPYFDTEDEKNISGCIS